MFNLKPDLSQFNLQELISQLTPEQSNQLRTFLVEQLLDEKTFNLNNPFFIALKKDTKGHFDILTKELKEKIQYLPESHPAKKLEI